MAKPIVSVVIPAYNEEKDITFCIKSLKNQTLKNFEIIIVDDGSTDSTIKIIKSLGKVRLFKQNHKGPGAARNLGAKNAKGEILVFVDSDMTFDKDYLKNLIRPFSENKNVIGTTHEYEIVENVSNIWSKCWGKIRVSPKNAKDVKIFRAIYRKKFLDLGEFDPSYGYADDQTFWFKYKLKPVVARNTICYHKNPTTLKQVYKQSRWIGASIDNRFLRSPLKYFIPFIMVIFSPLMIPLISIKKCYTNKDYIIFPAMLVFMTARYFGTIAGITRRIYFKINFR